MITCPKCFKENQDHYKFCLGCGAELPRDVSPKKFAPGTPPHGVPAAKAAPAFAIADEVTSVGIPSGPEVRPKPAKGPMGTAAIPQAPAAPGAAPPAAFAPPPPVAMAAPAPPVAAPPGLAAAHAGAPAPATSGPPPIACPQCDHPNPPNNKFCASCGFKLARPAAPPVEAAPAGVAAQPSGVVLTALRADGTEAGTYALPVGIITVGRDLGAIFAGDSYLSPRHATFRQPTGRLLVKDEDSLNGVYKKLTRDVPVEVKPNAVFRIGQEIIRYEPLAPEPPSPDGVERLGAPSTGYIGRIALIIGRDATGNAFPLPESGVQLGRERGDVLFPEDGYVSGLHGRLTCEGGRLFLTDLGSSNGSFIRLGEETELKSGDVLLMGQQLFRISM